MLENIKKMLENIIAETARKKETPQTNLFFSAVAPAGRSEDELYHCGDARAGAHRGLGVPRGLTGSYRSQLARTLYRFPKNL